MYRMKKYFIVSLGAILIPFTTFAFSFSGNGAAHVRVQNGESEVSVVHGEGSGEVGVKELAPSASVHVEADTTEGKMQGEKIGATRGVKAVEVVNEFRNSDKEDRKVLPIRARVHVRAKGDNGLHLGASEDTRARFREELREKMKRMKDSQEGEGKIVGSIQIKLGKNEVDVLRKELKEKIMKPLKLSSVNDISVESEGDEMHYRVKATKQFRLFGLFSVEGEVEVKVDAEDGKLIEVKKPWYSIFAF